MAKIVPAMQLTAHAKSSTLYVRLYGRNFKFSRLDGLLLFRIIMRLSCARCELRYYLIYISQQQIVMHRKEIVNRGLSFCRHLLVRPSFSFGYDLKIMPTDTTLHFLFHIHVF